MIDIYIPTLHTFAMSNVFTGSMGAFRFRIQPVVVKLSKKEVDFEQSTIEAEYWHGPFCYQKSTMEGKGVFPMTEEGRLEMKNWLESNI